MQRDNHFDCTGIAVKQCNLEEKECKMANHKFRSLALLVVGVVLATGFAARADEGAETAIDKLASSFGFLEGKRVDLTGRNLLQLRTLLQLSDELNDAHKSKRSLLFFFGRPADVDECGCREELDRLASEKRDSLIVVNVDPAAFPEADELQKLWLQGDPSYPTVVFQGNGTILNFRGAIKGEHVDDLVREGLSWDWHANHSDN